MSKPRILVIGTTDIQGGAAHVGWDIGQEHIKRGYDVKYLVGYKKSKKTYVYELYKPRILDWLDQHTRFNATALFRHLKAYIFANNIDTGASEEILRHPWYKKADIIHCHNLHGNYFKLDTLKKIASEKHLVWTLHDMSAITGKCAYTESPNDWKEGYHPCSALKSYPPMLWDNTQYMWNKKRQIYSDVRNMTVVTPSSWLQKIVQESILKKHPTKLIYNGIDTQIFKPNLNRNLRKLLNLPSDKKIILFAAQGGTKDPRKGWHYVEEIMEKYRLNDDVCFVCIGTGVANLRKNNLISLPYIQNKHLLAKYYQASDIFLFTSVAENCPLVILEAMACGLPIVSFDVGGVSEIVSHRKNGYIAKHKDVVDLEKGLEWILQFDSKKLKVITTANRQSATNKFSIENMADQYEELYNQLY